MKKKKKINVVECELWQSIRINDPTFTFAIVMIMGGYAMQYHMDICIKSISLMQMKAKIYLEEFVVAQEMCLLVEVVLL